MRRRSFVAACLTVLAGCSTLRQRWRQIQSARGNGGATESTTPTPTPTELPMTTSATPTETRTRTSTRTRTETSTETETPPDTESPTPTETPAAEGNTDLARRAMRRADEDIEAALEKYRSYQDGATSLLDVTASAGSFSWTAINTVLDKARDHLDEAIRLGSNRQIERAEKLRDVVQFIKLTARAQNQLIDAVNTLEEAVDLLYNNSLTTADRERSNMMDYVETATERLNEIDEQIDPAVFEVTDTLDRTVYNEKVDQFENEIDSLEVIDGDFDTLMSAMRTFGDAVEKYQSSVYDEATSGFFSSQASFDTAESVFTDHEAADSLQPQVDEFVCVATAMSEGSGLMAQSAAAGDNNDTERRRERKQAAIDAFSECETVVNEVEPVKRLMD
ncbi:MAG: hypothetical protein ABEH65_01170 [Halobacteriales archaeon]